MAEKSRKVLKVNSCDSLGNDSCLEEATSHYEFETKCISESAHIKWIISDYYSCNTYWTTFNSANFETHGGKTEWQLSMIPNYNSKQGLFRFQLELQNAKDITKCFYVNYTISACRLGDLDEKPGTKANQSSQELSAEVMVKTKNCSPKFQLPPVDMTIKEGFHSLEIHCCVAITTSSTKTVVNTPKHFR